MTTKFEELSQKHEETRQQIIRTEGEINPFKEYPELDAICAEMWSILYGDAKSIEISADKIVEYSVK